MVNKYWIIATLYYVLQLITWKACGNYKYYNSHYNKLLQKILFYKSSRKSLLILVEVQENCYFKLCHPLLYLEGQVKLSLLGCYHVLLGAPIQKLAQFIGFQAILNSQVHTYGPQGVLYILCCLIVPMSKILNSTLHGACLACL